MITVVGAGTIGTALYAFDDVQLFPRAVWGNMIAVERQAALRNTEVFVNASGLVGAGKCDANEWEEVVCANVAEAVDFVRQLSVYGVPVISLSTAAVYAKQSCPYHEYHTSTQGSVGVGAPVYPHNRYAASKILMEEAVRGSRVLRLPFFKKTLEASAKNWDVVQDTFTSIIDATRLRACLHVLKDAAPGVYQAHSDVIYLPDKFPNLKVRRHVPVGMSAAVPLVESPIFKVSGEIVHAT